jgi:hypothetical protein
MDDMSNSEPAETFTSDTTDECDDNARTEQNRKGAPQTDADKNENVEQRSRAKPADRPPVREHE